MIRLRCLPLIAAAVIGTQACATAGAAAYDEMPAGSGSMRDRGCRVAASPAQLPAAATLVDVEAFRFAAARLLPGDGGGHVVFSIRHDAGGVQVRRAVIETTLPPALTDSLQRLVFAYRRETAPAQGEWGVRLRVDLGNTVALQVGRRDVCAARPREWEYRTAGNAFDVREASASSTGDALLTDASVAWVHVRLDERGTVTDVQVQRGASTRLAEQRLMNYVRSMAFIPATEDGFPVPGELTLPVRVSMSN
jgi:TonB family protein